MHESDPANDPVPPSSTTLRLAVPLQDHLGVPDGTILAALPDDAGVELDLDGGEAVDLADVLTSLGARCAVRIHHVESRWAVPEPVHLAARVLERALAAGAWGSPGDAPDRASSSASTSASEEIAAGTLGPEQRTASVAEAMVRLPIDLDGEALAFANSTGTPGVEVAALRDGLEQALVLIRSFQHSYARTTSRRVRLATLASLPPVVPAAVAGSAGDITRAAVPTEVGPTCLGPPLGVGELALLREAFTTSPPRQAFGVVAELSHALDVALANEDLLTAVLLAPAIVEAALRDTALMLLWRAGVAPATARAQVDVRTVGELIDGSIAGMGDWSDQDLQQLHQWSDQLLVFRDRALRWGRWPSRREAHEGRRIARQLIDYLESSLGANLLTPTRAFEEWRAEVAE